MAKKIVVLGAGYAGIQAALTLHKKKKKNEDIEISIIDKNSYHTLLTELHEVAGNRINEDGVIVPLKDIFKYTDVKIIKDEFTSIDFSEKKVHAKGADYSYDYLIIGAGSNPNYFGIEGMKENSFSLWSYDDAIRIREQIKDCFQKASQIENEAERKALLTFVVGGGGFTGVEMMGELAQWVKSLCKMYGFKRSAVKLYLVEALPKILNNLTDKNIEKSMNYLTNKLKVEVLTGCAITKLTETEVYTKDGRVIPTRTLIWTAGVRASCLSDEIDIEKARACRVQVNEYTQTKQHPNVFAIGDFSAFPKGDNILPALVEAAIQTGEAAAENVLATIRGQEMKKLEPKFHGVMVSIGSFFAVSDIMGMRLPVFLSIIMKYMVNIHYLFGIGGFELIFKYLRHELLHKQQKKFLLEKHYSVQKPIFWLVPLRLFLGYAWLMEGIKKLQTGWLDMNHQVLTGRFADAASSASTSGSGAAEAAVKTIHALTPNGLLTVDSNTFQVVEKSTEVAKAAEKSFALIYDYTPGWYAWIVEHFILPNAGLFQVMIVLAEIAIGLALITGTFTFLAGLAALGLNINFFLSTGLLESAWWYIPAAIAMLCGAGRTFGVDHYLIPYLARQWRYFVRNKRIKLWLTH